MKKRDLAKQIVEQLRKKGFESYWAGGCVRDMLLRQNPKDYDIATKAAPDQVRALFPKVIPVGEKFGVVMVVVEGEHFEIATFRTEGKYSDGRRPDSVSFASAEEDAHRRDFTMNGLFYDPVTEKVLDFVGGQEAIQKRVVETVGDPAERFQEDKLRLLRAIRFASTLSFEIESRTFEVLKRLASEIKKVAPERIREELAKILTRPGAGRGLELLSESGLLREILPEVEAMKGVEQPKEFHPEGDVFVHTRLMLDQLDHPSITLAFACLLHDVGKPPTFQVADRIRFNEHAEVGARMAEAILERLRFSNEEKEKVVACVQNHMRFKEVQRMREGKLKRLLQDPTFPEQMELHRIDCASSHGNLGNWEFLKQKLQEYREEDIRPKPFLTGGDLLALGFKEGPLLGKILNEVNDRQLEGELKSKNEALSWVRVHYSPSSG